MYSYDQLMMNKKDKQKINKKIYEQLAEQPFARKILRLTWPDRKADADIQKEMISLRKKGIELNIDRDDGTLKSKPQIKREIKQAQLKLNDVRQVNDMKLKRIMTEELLNPILPYENPKRDKLFEEAGKVSPAEPRRLANKYKKWRESVERKRQGNVDWRAFYRTVEEGEE